MQLFISRANNRDKLPACQLPFNFPNGYLLEYSRKFADVLRVNFQVEAPVTRRSPHRPGREDFPHPVPRSPEALRQWLTQQATPRWAHNFAVLQ